MLTGNEKYLFGSIDDCCLCPFSPQNMDSPYLSDFYCSGDPNGYTPCTIDELKNMTLEEAVSTVNLNILRDEEYADRLYRKRKEKEHRNKEIAKKRQQTRTKNYALNNEISRLRYVIRKRESAINSLIALQSAFSFANDMMAGKVISEETEKSKNPQVILWEEANRQDKLKLEQLIKERTKRNRESRKG